MDINLRGEEKGFLLSCGDLLVIRGDDWNVIFFGNSSSSDGGAIFNSPGLVYRYGYKIDVSIGRH